MSLHADRRRILCFGRDALLLNTRAWVLATRYEVVSVHTLQEFEAFTGAIDLIVLCHTLSATECRACEDIAKRRWPGVSTVTLSITGLPCMPRDAGRVVHPLDGPSVLLAAVQQTMSTSLTDRAS